MTKKVNRVLWKPVSIDFVQAQAKKEKLKKATGDYFEYIKRLSPIP